MRLIPVPAFEDNYIWLVIGEDGRTAIVDPGESVPVEEALERLNLKPVAILLTHHHADHVGGVKALSEHYHLPVYGPAHEARALVTHPLEGGDTVDLPGIGCFDVLFTPGHTLGHIVFHAPGVLLCGDTLFTAGCGRLFEGSAAQMADALGRIARLPDETEVYCAHEYTADNLRFARHAEPENAKIRAREQDTAERRSRGEPTVPSTLGLEKETNPFLRLDNPSLLAGAERHAGHPLRTDAERFAAVRHWKDVFDGLV